MNFGAVSKRVGRKATVAAGLPAFLPADPRLPILQDVLACIAAVAPNEAGLAVALAMLARLFGAEAAFILAGEGAPPGAPSDPTIMARFPDHAVLDRPIAPNRLLTLAIGLERGLGLGRQLRLVRAPHAAPFAEADEALMTAIGPLLTELMRLNPASKPTDLAASIDGVTGFWTEMAFYDEVSRRLDRLDVEAAPGTMLLIGLQTKDGPLRDELVRLAAEELRETFRPSDVLGRLSPTRYLAWCDGMDHLTGAERAARLCQRLPVLLRALPAGEGMLNPAVGIATRWPGGEQAQGLMTRAALALKAAEAARHESHIGTWRLWHGGMTP
ncbi:MAG TPA: hypothetical protein PLC74_00120 [Acetobacteraceae bacterium]|nr:hypothetical protein [Acetobacteraceae bacterium]